MPDHSQSVLPVWFWRWNAHPLWTGVRTLPASVGASDDLTPRGQSDRCTCDPDADGTTDLFCPVHSVSFPLTNTIEDEERASWADREPDDPPS